MRNLNAMTQQLQAVMRLQLQQKREKRLQCDDDQDGDPGPATLAHRARAEEFTPPCKRQRELVPPTSDSDDDDLESLATQASSTRKKVQPEFLFVDSKDTPKCNHAEIRVWLQSYAIRRIFVRETSPGMPLAAPETSTGAISHYLGGVHTCVSARPAL